jgi:hypothetical protein
MYSNFSTIKHQISISLSRNSSKKQSYETPQRSNWYHLHTPISKYGIEKKIRHFSAKIQEERLFFSTINIKAIFRLIWHFLCEFMLLLKQERKIASNNKVSKLVKKSSLMFSDAI